MDEKGRPSLGRRHDLVTNEWTTVEFEEEAIAKSGAVNSDYNPLDGLVRKD